MKRIIDIWLAASVLAGVLISFSNAQVANDPNSNPQEPSLGSYARAVRKDKKQEATKRFDNDNLPQSDRLSVVGDASATADSPVNPADATQQAAAAGATQETPRMLPGQSPEDRQKVMDHWQEKLSEQNAQIDALSQKLNLAQREYRVHAAEYYNDPSQRMSAAAWGKDDAEYKQKIADQQKAIDEAKQKFSDLEEEARHSGVPNSVREAVEQKPEAEPEQPETAPQQP
jgi:hypothetical protein